MKRFLSVVFILIAMMVITRTSVQAECCCGECTEKLLATFDKNWKPFIHKGTLSITVEFWSKSVGKNEIDKLLQTIPHTPFLNPRNPWNYKLDYIIIGYRLEGYSLKGNDKYELHKITLSYKGTGPEDSIFIYYDPSRTENFGDIKMSSKHLKGSYIEKFCHIDSWVLYITVPHKKVFIAYIDDETKDEISAEELAQQLIYGKSLYKDDPL